MQPKSLSPMIKLVPYVILLIITTIFVFPLFSGINNVGKGDWDFFCFHNELPRNSILEYHQFPLWNPYASGGRPLLADPQVGFLSPTFLSTLLFGCVIGLKIKVFLMLLIGMIGMFLLSQYYRMTKLAGIFVASIFCLSSYLSLHIAEGHIVFLPVLFFPYVFLFYVKSFEQKRYVIFSALALVLTIFEGGIVIPLLGMILFLCPYGLLAAFKKKSTIPLLNLAAIFMIAFLLSAIRYSLFLLKIISPGIKDLQE